MGNDPTQYRHNNIILQDFDRSTRYKIQARQHIAFVYERIAGGCMCRFEF